MHLKTLINDCCKFNGFVVKNPNLSKKIITVPIIPRKNSRPICSSCGEKGPGYDTLNSRKFSFIPFWGYEVFFEYSMRRVNCKTCGVTVEAVPWASGKSPVTHIFASYLSNWAKLLPIKTVAKCFKVTWQNVCDAVMSVVDYGLENREIEDVEILGIDEVQYHKGHNYMTLAYDISSKDKKLLWLDIDRTKETMRKFYDEMTEKKADFCDKIKVVCTDMWAGFTQVAKEKIPKALNVLDRFHIMKKFNETLDDIRRSELKRLKKNGEDVVLKDSRWCLLKQPFNLNEKQKTKLEEVLTMNENLNKAYLLRELFQFFWQCKDAKAANEYLELWLDEAEKADLPKMSKVIKMLRKKRELILNYFRSEKRHSSGAVEGLNRKVNLIIRQAYGFKNFNILKAILYHQMGKLPEPQFEHNFW